MARNEVISSGSRSSLLKTTCLLLLASLAALAGCSTPPPRPAEAPPETVLVTYHVKPGQEAALEQVLARAWEVYRRDHLVFARPHVIVRDTEEGGRARVIEIFTWVSRSIPAHAPEDVKALWKEEESLCERRGGHYGIEPGEVELIVGR